MAIKKKQSHTKAYVAIVLVAIIAIATVAVAYATYGHSTKAKIIVGVHVGDTFYYNITGESILFTAGADPDAYYTGFSQLNNTNYYKVTITGVNGVSVSLNTDWAFNNGTDIQNSQTINLATGQTTDPQGFWGIYASNLKLNGLLYPDGTAKLIVNSTGSEQFSSGLRTNNYWSTERVNYLTTDPTLSTLQDNTIEVSFDTHTGVLTYLNNIIAYNNPEMNLIITWLLTNSTVWSV
jgi:hypothetical protein